MFMKLTETLRY